MPDHAISLHTLPDSMIIKFKDVLDSQMAMLITLNEAVDALPPHAPGADIAVSLIEAAASINTCNQRVAHLIRAIRVQAGQPEQ